MADIQEATYEGTWDELLQHAVEFGGKKLRLTVLSAAQNQSSVDQSRIAAIDAVFGKYANLGVSVDDLHFERQKDKAAEDHAPTSTS